jgi:methylmalonyl-CoA mutase cobalamin-binding subunit
MTKAAGALAQFSSRVEQASLIGLRDIENDVIGVSGVSARHHAERSKVVQLQRIANPPCDEVIGAGLIAADAEASDLFAAANI